MSPVSNKIGSSGGPTNPYPAPRGRFQTSTVNHTGFIAFLGGATVTLNGYSFVVDMKSNVGDFIQVRPVVSGAQFPDAQRIQLDNTGGVGANYALGERYIDA